MIAIWFMGHLQCNYKCDYMNTKSEQTKGKLVEAKSLLLGFLNFISSCDHTIVHFCLLRELHQFL